MKRSQLLAAVVAILLGGFSIAQLIAAQHGVVRTVEVVEGVPIEIFTPADLRDGKRRPGVVVAHGFSGNRQLMYGFGYSLARNGYVAALIDFAGHGSSLARMPQPIGSEAQQRRLLADLETARAHLRSRPFVHPERVAILGHSMGASAVTRFAIEHADVPATVAVSLGNFGLRLPPNPDRPRNLLLLVGALEFSGFIEGSTAGLRAAYPEGSSGQTYGDAATGTARRLVFVPNVEHISVLFSQEAHREVVRWLDMVFSQPRIAPIQTDSRIGWVLLGYLAAAIGFFPLAALVLGHRHTPWSGRPVPAGWVIAIVLGAAILSPLLLSTGLIPFQHVPLTVGNYVGAYFLIFGGIAAVGWVLLRRRVPALNTAIGEEAAPHPIPWRSRLGLVVLALYALGTLGILAHLTWNNYALVGDRSWIFVLLLIGCLAFFLMDEILVMRKSLAARAALYALTKLIVLTSLLASVFLLGAPTFLLLLAPVMVVLFIWHGVYAHWLFRLTGQPWAGALINALVFAWTIAATFALVS